jgi:hypothetical protein
VGLTQRTERKNCNFLARKNISRFSKDELSQTVNDTMATISPCLAQLSRIYLHTRSQGIRRSPAMFLAPSFQVRHKSRGANAAPIESKASKALKASKSVPQKNKKKGMETKKRKPRTVYKQYDLRAAEQFSLCDAIRYAHNYQRVSSY